MKKFLAIILCIVMLLPDAMCIGTVYALPERETESYEGDYVLAFNPSESVSDSKATGTVSDVKSRGVSDAKDGEKSYPIYLSIPATEEQEAQLREQMKKPVAMKTTYSVGDIHSWTVMNIQTYTNSSVKFECIGVGEYCYIWTATDADYAPLDATYVDTVINEFDSNYPMMQEAFGDFYSPDGSGKVNILFYDIKDGYTGSGGYVGGYFYANDMAVYSNHAAILHIDTYPTLSNGLDEAYSTMMHELQHMINYSVSGTHMDTWLNECMSMAAEELIYPNSAVPMRLYTWSSSYPLFHEGKSHFDYDNSLDAYALQCLFGQYLRAQTGGYEVFSRILTNFANGMDEKAAVVAALDGTALEGATIDRVIMYFRIATICRQPSGPYGFCGDTRFDSMNRVTVTGNKNVRGCGAVIYETKSGAYTVPADADDGLVYIGMTKSGDIISTSTPLDITHTVEFVDGVTHDTIATVTVAHGEDVVFPEVPDHTAEGYNFTGWDSDGKNIRTNTTITAEYVLRVYVVRFVDGLTDDVISTIPVEHGADVEFPEAPDHSDEGYSFVEWDSDGKNITSNTTITASYEKNVYTVIFKDGLKNQIIAVESVEHGDDAPFPEAPDHYSEGYDFVGWDSDGKNITDDAIITAQYNAAMFTVTFADGFTGATIATVEVIRGGDVELPEAPVHESQNFLGWDHDGKNITEDTTITAQYETKTFTVTFIDGMTSEIFDTQTVEYGQDAIVPDPPEHEGFMFAGWDGIATNITADTEIIAMYNVQTFIVVFKDGLTHAIIAAQPVEYGKDAVFPEAPDHTAEGYTFIGWDDLGYCIMEDRTITANYEVSTFTVTFIDGVTEDVIDTQTVEYGEDAVFPEAPDHTADGYDFSGWDKMGKTITSDTVITAKYKKRVYTVSFVNGVTGAIFNTRQVEHGGDVDFPTSIPNNKGYTFAGWDNEGKNVTSDMTITALYNPIPIDSFELDQTTITIFTEHYTSMQIVPKNVDPKDAPTFTLIWTSSNENVATVEDGLVMAVAPGAATITARNEAGTCEVSCTVKVGKISNFIFKEDFENFDASAWTIIDADGDGNNWYIGNKYIDDKPVDKTFEGEHCMVSASYLPGKPLTPDNWLISPSFTVTESALLAWTDIGQDPSAQYEKYEVYVLAKNYTDLSEGTNIWKMWSRKEFSIRSVDISKFAGQEIRLAFRHFGSTDKFRLNIDYITVSSNWEIPTEITPTPTPTGAPTAEPTGEPTTPPTGEPTTQPGILVGDLNGDGKINTGDATFVLKVAAEMIVPTEAQRAAGDCNRDGKVNTGDAVIILKYAAGMITEI